MLLTELQTYSLTHLAKVPFSSTSSADNSFSFISEKGIDILELSPDPKSVSPSLSCRRYVIKTSTDLPTSQLDINPSELLSQLDREDVYSLISDTTMSPQLNRTLSPTPAPRCALWSPIGILKNHRCVLAVLTDTGSLCLYLLKQHEYCGQGDIGTLWLNHCRAGWPKAPRDPDKRLTLLRTRADTVKLTAMCWLEQVEAGVGWLAAVSKSGMVSLWQVQADASAADSLEVHITLVTQFDSGLRAPTVLQWTTLSSKHSLLTVGALDGRVCCFTLSPSVPALDESIITSDCAAPPTNPYSVIGAQEVWTEQDRITVNHLASWPWQEGLLLVAVKGAFVIALYLSDTGERLAYSAYRSCDTSVNGLSQLSEDEMLLVTRSCRFTRLSFLLTDDKKLSITTDNVESYINISSSGCYGFSMTLNKVICFIQLSMNQSYDHLRMREPTQVVVCSVGGSSVLEPQAILQQPHRPISHLWDCLELLRVQILQKVLVSEVSYPRSVLDSLTINQLTSTLWWVTFATAAEEEETKHRQLVKLRHEVETLVISCHLFKYIALMLSNNPETLSSFQLQSLGVLHKWLIKLQDLPKEFTTTLITGKTLLQQLKSLEDKIPGKELCAICGTVIPDLKLLFFSECSNGHTLPRCSLSLVQCCQLPYFACAQCGGLAHPLAVEECGVICNLCGGVLRLDEDIL